MLLRKSKETMIGFQPAEQRIERGKIDPSNRRRAPRPGMIVLAGIACAAFAIFIYSGIRSRTEAEKRLAQNVRASLIPLVTVIHPKGGAAAQAIELPGNTQAFTEAPIYARTSGYLKQWYLDIGAHAKRGQLLAEIETPELDQQLQQAESELKTAQDYRDPLAFSAQN
jgi:multidrug efflux pump subunit AcrA (membrane-fusion protein)